MKEKPCKVSNEVRALIQSLLKDGVKPSRISFVLCKTATELGLEITEGSLEVLPLVLAGVSEGVVSVLNVEQDEGEEQDSIPQGAVIH